MQAWLPLVAFAVVVAAACGPGAPPPLPGETLPGAAPFDAPTLARLRAAWAARPAGYTPRTRHLLPDGAPRYTNRLFLETSPYLLQHAHNPVELVPVGRRGVRHRAPARPPRAPLRRLLHLPLVPRDGGGIVRGRGDRPLSERALRRHQGRPRGAPGRRRGLHERGADAHRRRRVADDRLAHARSAGPSTAAPTSRRATATAVSGVGFLTRAADAARRRTTSSRRASPRRPASLTEQVRANLDGASRGDVALAGTRPLLQAATRIVPPHRSIPSMAARSGRPKFPSNLPVRFLLRHHRRTGDPDALHMATVTLERMAAGGIHDHVGGGFHRYATDARWLVPHFEKMLYDNALLALAYLEALSGDRPERLRRRRARDPALRRARHDGARGRLLLGDRRRQPGARRSARGGAVLHLDAGGDPGAVLDAGRRRASSKRTTAVTAAGNFEGRSILLRGDAARRRRHGARARSPDARRSCWRRRGTASGPPARERPPPLRDEKVLAAWNGLDDLRPRAGGPRPRRGRLRGTCARRRRRSCSTAMRRGRTAPAELEGRAGWRQAGLPRRLRLPHRGAARPLRGHRRSALAVGGDRPRSACSPRTSRTRRPAASS